MRSLYTLWPTYTSSVKEKPADWFRRDGEHLRIFQTSPCTRISMNAVSVWCCPQQIEFLEAMRLQDRSYDESALPLPFVNLDHYFSRSWWGKVKKILAIENFQKVIQTQVSQQRPAVSFNQLPLPVFFFFVLKVFGSLELWDSENCKNFEMPSVLAVFFSEGVLIFRGNLSAKLRSRNPNPFIFWLEM